MFPALRSSKTSPGAEPMMSEGTIRESEQVMKRVPGLW